MRLTFGLTFMPKRNESFVKMFSILILILTFCHLSCDARLFGNIPNQPHPQHEQQQQQHHRGGLLFGGAARVQERPRGGPLVSGHLKSKNPKIDVEITL